MALRFFSVTPITSVAWIALSVSAMSVVACSSSSDDGGASAADSAVPYDGPYADIVTGRPDSDTTLDADAPDAASEADAPSDTRSDVASETGGDVAEDVADASSDAVTDAEAGD